MKETTSTGRMVFNGIDGATGEYLIPPMPPEELARHIARPGERVGERRLMPGVDPRELSQAGWGVMFPEGQDPAIREALAPLLALREEQAGPRFRVYRGEEGLRPTDGVSAILGRLGVGPGPVSPDKAPYYLLLVGTPEEISFQQQFELGLMFAVGRLCLGSPDEYRQYAESVVAAERGEVKRRRAASFLGVRNPDDMATAISCGGMVHPLGARLRDLYGEAGWQVDLRLEEEATRDRFRAVFGGDETPALVFSASHGMGFPADDPRLESQHGALLCQDWPGPKAGRLRREHYFAAEDVGDDADVAGLIAFTFACFGAGVPASDSFFFREKGTPERLAPRPMVARLPQRLLSHPGGGALATIGHVDRAWGCSFIWERAYQLDVFEAALTEMLDGVPVGAAMEQFSDRHGQLAAMLSGIWGQKAAGETVDAEELVHLWTATSDARAYVILGDPAVRLTSVVEAATQ